MISVCIDTSVLASVAVVDDGRTLAHATDPNPRRQAEGLGDLFTDCLSLAGFPGPTRDAGIERVIVGTGPGPYTGLRAGLAFAAALGQGLGVPVVGVSSQEILGLAATRRLAEEGGLTQTALVMTDARRREVYYSVWEGGEGGPTLLSGPAVDDLQVALEEARGAAVFFAGPVPAHLAETLEGVGARFLDLDAALLEQVVLLRENDPEYGFSLEPQYLRRPDVNVK